ncbi:MAG: site-2 protease family protein [Planctomycetaceae bacterium]
MSSGSILTFRVRPDVEVHPQAQRGSNVFVLKDPLSLRYFQLREEEHFLWRLLDGTRSFDELRVAFRQKFGPRELTNAELQTFVARLHRDGLVVSDKPGRGLELATTATLQQQTSRMNNVFNPLVIRFSGWDPQRFLDRVLARMDWVFRPAFAWCSLGIVLVALFLVVCRLTSSSASLIPFQSMLEPENLVWLSVCLATAKVLHEFGHAIVCRRFGAECHEMGVMLLAFTPCLYCDVSDSWTLRSKWNRIAVSMAGIAVDILLASLCAIVWCSTEPGFLNAACLNMMFVCSVSTLIFNGNPLMRYDGYYVLQDFIEEPNLRPNARSWMRHVFVRWFTGVSLLRASERPTSRRGFLFVWGVASTIYVWFVIAVILALARSMLEPRGLAPVADVITLLMLLRVAVLPCYQLVQTVIRSNGVSKVNWPRFVFRSGLVAAAVLGLFIVPLPHTLTIPATVSSNAEQRVFAQSQGTLVRVASPGTQVHAGDVVATLSDIDIDLAAIRLRGEFRKYEARVRNLKTQQANGDDVAASQVAAAEGRLIDLQQRLSRREAERQKLNIVATRSGVILNPKRAEPEVPSGELPAVSGYVTEQQNQNCFVGRETVLCTIGDPSSSEVTLTVTQDDVAEFQIGEPIRLQLEQVGIEPLPGTVVGLSRMDARGSKTHAANVPAEFQNKALYQVRVSIDSKTKLLIGDAGNVRVGVAPCSLLSRMVSYVGRTFRWPIRS